MRLTSMNGGTITEAKSFGAFAKLFSRAQTANDGLIRIDLSDQVKLSTPEGPETPTVEGSVATSQPTRSDSKPSNSASESPKLDVLWMDSTPRQNEAPAPASKNLDWVPSAVESARAEIAQTLKTDPESLRPLSLNRETYPDHYQGLYSDRAAFGSINSRPSLSVFLQDDTSNYLHRHMPDREAEPLLARWPKDQPMPTYWTTDAATRCPRASLSPLSQGRSLRRIANRLIV